MKDLTFTSPPEFRTVSEFAFQNPQGETETNAYYETVDHALREIDDLAFAFPAGLAIPNPYGLDFSSEFLAILVENLHQHEMPPGGALYYRSYIASEPVLGLRVEFWGAGMHPLPPALTTKEWFTAQDSPPASSFS